MENKEGTHLIYVLEDGKTWCQGDPIFTVSVTDEQLSLIKDGGKVSDVVPDWDCPRRITSVEAVESGSANVEMQWDEPGVGKTNSLSFLNLPKVECPMPNPFDGLRKEEWGEGLGLLSIDQVQCLQKVLEALGTGKFKHKSLDDPETRRDLKEFLRVNLEDVIEASLDYSYEMTAMESAQKWIGCDPGDFIHTPKVTAMESAQKYIDKTEGKLTEEQVKDGHLVLHTIKVWVDHQGETSLAVDISKNTILDLVERGEVTRHTLDGASVWDRDSEGRDICIDPDPPKVLEKLQEEYIDEHESESNIYELCSVCQESINPDRPHECVDIEGMKTGLLRYSFRDVEEDFRHLSTIEKDIIGSQENFDRLLSTLRSGGE